MPDIAPALPIATAVQAPAGGVSPLPAAPADADPAGTDFVGQLTAALKSLASAVSPPQNAPGRAQKPVLQAPLAASGPQPAQADAGPQVPDSDPDELPELLAMLGFVVVPTVLQPATVTAPDGREGSCSVVDSTSAPAAPQLTSPGAVAEQPQTPDLPTAADDSVGQGPNRPTSEPADVSTDSEANGGLPKTTTDVRVRPFGAREPRRPQAARRDDAGAMAAAPPVIPEGTPAQQVDSASPVATSTATLVQPRSHLGSAPERGAGGDAGEHQSSRTLAPVESASGGDTTPQIGSEPAFSASMAQVSAPGTAPADVAAGQASQVVSQIAHQAELYRLPGNRGVRIQLHPEDLGGVQVTVRYAAGGGLELHINVEHAATGTLVQAGWAELRDALATQGIAPDRLVMSVTGPHNTANQSDFSSSGGGSHRPDAGLAQFGQGGQSNGQRQSGADGPRLSRAWNAPVDATPSTDDSSRVAISSGASRIDYRV